MPVCWLMFHANLFCMWQMLLPFFLWQMLLPLLYLVGGRFCYHHSLLVDIIANVYVLLDCVADVVATVAVSIAILKDGVSYFGRCYYHIVVGQCYCHSYVLLDCVADVIATVAVGIAIL